MRPAFPTSIQQFQRQFADEEACERIGVQPRAARLGFLRGRVVGCTALFGCSSPSSPW